MADNIGGGAIAGIALGSLILGGVIAIAVYKYRVDPAYVEGPRGTKLIDYFSIVNWFKVLYYFLPYAVFLFGIVYDGLFEKIRFFPAGFVGLLAVYVNSWISYNKDAKYNDICGIPGLSGWGSDISPQNMVFVSAVLSYIATYITVKRNTITDMSSGAAWIGVASVWIIQTIFYNVTGCNTTISWRTFGSARIVPPLLALIWGGGIGAIFGFVFSTFVSVGDGVSDQQKQLLTSTKGPAMAPTSETAGAGKCSSTDSDDAFVCEAYKNGELVTSTIVE